MQIQCFENEFPYIIIDDYYNEHELNLIWREINFLGSKSKMYPGSDPNSGSAMDKEGNYLKNNFSLHVDPVYTDRSFSNILSCSEKITENTFQLLKSHSNWFFKNIRPNMFYTSLSYYEDGDHYLPHWDESSITCLTWLYKEPKSFDGGELNFYDYNIDVEIKNNRILIFPSCIKHQVLPVKMKSSDYKDNMGRYCITNFLVCSMEYYK